MSTNEMWASPHNNKTPVLTTPATGLTTPIGSSSWSDETYYAGHSPGRVELELGTCPHVADIGSLTMINSAGGCQQEEEDQQQQQQAQQQRGRTAGKKRAVFGTMRRLLSRSRSASKESPRPGVWRSSSLRAPAAAAQQSSTTMMGKNDNCFRSEFAGRRLFSLRATSRSRTTQTTTTMAAGGGEDDPEGYESSPRSDRGGREENFHIAMENKLVHMAFTAFCKKTLSSENVEFVRQVCVCYEMCVFEQVWCVGGGIYLCV